MTMLTGDQIPIYRLIVLLKGIELEGKGIKVSKRRSCLTIVKKEFGWTGNRAKIHGRLAWHIQTELERLGFDGKELEQSNSRSLDNVIGEGDTNDN